MTRIGVISDTHGLLRREALKALRGSDLILHAGDIGSPDVVGRLERLAPVTAVRGNVDKEAWADRFPDDEVIEVEGRCIYMLHDLQELDLDPAGAGFDVVVSGHSHLPKVERRRGVLYVNPGSAGPRRFRLPTAVAVVTVSRSRMAAKIVELRV